jgi:hypothetical protein
VWQLFRFACFFWKGIKFWQNKHQLFVFFLEGGPPPVVSFFPQRSCNRVPGARKDRKRMTQVLDGRGSHCKVGKSVKSICFWKFVHLVSGMRLGHDFFFPPFELIEHCCRRSQILVSIINEFSDFFGNFWSFLGPKN